MSGRVTIRVAVDAMDEPLELQAGGPAPVWGAAEEEFLRLHLRRVFLLIYRIVGNVEDAQDLAQETFIKALQRGGQLRDLTKAGHWLSRIASNTAIDFLRRHGRMPALSLDDLLEPLRAPAELDPERQLLRAESRRGLESGLSRLTERERLALVLRDVEDLPVEEVAALLGCGKATVRSHIANARVKFRQYLEHSCNVARPRRPAGTEPGEVD
jgi:RNA polymerase sigma-70 factor (ECF subfamily)